MRIPHDSYVLVADGAKMLFFRNEGDADNLNLTVLAAQQQADLYDREIKTDFAGQKPAGMGAGGSTAGEADFHKQAEDRFAAEAAQRINRAALANEFERLIIVAPPKTLGHIRKKLHKEAERRIVLTVNKTMTDRPIPDIEELLVGEGAPPA